MSRFLVSALILAAALMPTACRREKIHPEPTEEGYVSLSSKVNMGDPAMSLHLVRGFHQIEQNAWRWTMGRFAITLRTPDDAARKGAALVAHFAAPEPLISRNGAVTLTARVGGQTVGTITCATPGQYTLRAEVPKTALAGETVTFEFVLDKFLTAGTLDGRELGVIVSNIGLETP